MHELAVLFPCQGEELVGIITLPAAGQDTWQGSGVLIVVGGPQYRAGSHRQFVLLARHLARAGIPCMRFDYRGMGDATGARRDFEQVSEDIRAAIDAFLAREPRLGGVVLWGLCDGASAALLYAPQDARVRGLLLLNPWVRTTTGEAQAMLRHYYLKRLLAPDFWKKLLTGRVALGRSVREVGERVASLQERPGAAADTAGASAQEASLPERMQHALQRAGVPWQVLLSGRDYVAREFDQVASSPAWAALQPEAHILRVAQADHTFSTAAWRDQVADLTVSWVQALDK